MLRDLGLKLGAGLLAQVVATITRLPDMIAQLAAGALFGPSVLGLVANPLDGAPARLSDSGSWSLPACC